MMYSIPMCTTRLHVSPYVAWYVWMDCVNTPPKALASESLRYRNVEVTKAYGRCCDWVPGSCTLACLHPLPRMYDVACWCAGAAQLTPVCQCPRRLAVQAGSDPQREDHAAQMARAVKLRTLQMPTLTPCPLGSHHFSRLPSRHPAAWAVES